MNPEKFPRLTGMRDGKSIALTKRVFTVGSDTSCGLRLKSSVSGRIAHFLFRNGTYHLQVLAKGTAITVNENSIRGSHSLNHGDIVSFDNQAFRFLLREEAKFAPAPRAASPVMELIEIIVSLLRDQDRDVFAELVASISRLLKCDAARLLSEAGDGGDPDTLARFPEGVSLSRFSNRAIDWARSSGRAVLAGGSEWETGTDSGNSLKRNLVGSILCTPLMDGESIIGFLYMDRLQKNEPFTGEDLRFCDALGPLFEQILKNREQRKRQRETIARLQEQKISFQSVIIHDSVIMKEVLQTAVRVAPTDMPVSITGETGTGKELVARHIHLNSLRRSKPFIAINCGSIPENLIESELFGHEKGSFTGAHQLKKGLFECAGGGTLLLDEIGEFPMSMQVKLLRALQECEINRIGGTTPIKTDVRIISTTNRNLAVRVKEGHFREDLFFRLNGVNIHVPPLRDRGNDVVLIADYFVTKYCQQFGLEAKSLSQNARKNLKEYAWVGNIRELENIIQRSVLLCNTNKISEKDLNLNASPFYDGKKSLQSIQTLKEIRNQAEKEAIEGALLKWQGNVSRTARQLDIDRTWLMKLMKELKIEPASFRKR